MPLKYNIDGYGEGKILLAPHRHMTLDLSMAKVITAVNASKNFVVWLVGSGRLH